MKLLFIFTAVGYIQDPITAGVRKALLNIYKILSRRGYKIELLAPKGSICTTSDIPIIPIEGGLQDHLPHNKQVSFYPIHKNSFLQNALRYAHKQEKKYDLIINFSNDWLPYYMTPFFETPLIHRMNLSNENEVVSEIIQKIAKEFPYRVGVLTKSQSEDVGIEENCFLLGQGLDIDSFPFHEKIEKRKHLAFIARISPEKGLEDAVEIAKRSNHKLLVFGHIQDQKYFDKIVKIYGNTIIHKGHLPHEQLMSNLESCKALIFTPKWEEAFGGVIIQTMVCGIPVISYERGGSKDVIIHGKNGFLVPSDNIEYAVKMIDYLPEISAHDCRTFVVKNYSLKNLGDTYEAWFEKVRED